ncbi:cupin domain-containing protein [Nitrospira sp. BLG_2]|uniref:cupin domain-containing protein n=1 Tax=Nitrospira sp. BLG_2 TaxID=3397507 RepID=UPI003B9B22E6
MSGYIINIEEATTRNEHYRQVLFTAHHTQLVLMSLKPGEEIGEEVHDLDQFIRFEAGEGSVVLDGKPHSVSDGYAVVIPAGTRHNVMNRSSTTDLKLYSLYSPPEHKDKTIHRTKRDADADEHHHFDGNTSVS